MGVDLHYYVFYGIRFDISEKSEEFFNKYNQAYPEIERTELSIIIDNMGGKYIYIGNIIANSGNFRYAEFEDVEKEIDLTKFDPDMRNKIKDFVEKFKLGFEIKEDTNVKLYAFLHCS
jgi:hypothetical protein